MAPFSQISLGSVARVGTVLLLLQCAASGCSSKGSGSDASPAADGARWKGFLKLPDLGSPCTAAVDTAPAEHYPAMAFIPCPSGEADCEQLAWTGALSWDPTGSGDMLVFLPGHALDDAGRLSRLSLVHLYPKYSGGGGLPFETVIFDVLTGKPLAAFRNVGDVYPAGSGVVGGTECAIMPVVSQAVVSVLAVASQSSKALVAHAPIERAADIAGFMSLGADATVLDGRLSSSNQVLGMEQSDGKILAVDLASDRVVAAYGPGLRVWLHGVVGGDLLAFNDKGTGVQFFRLGPDGQFSPHPMTGRLLQTDGNTIAYLADSTLDVWRAPYSSDGANLDAGKVNVASIGTGDPVASTIGADQYAVLVASSALATPVDCSVKVVDLASGNARTARLPPQDYTPCEAHQLLAVDSAHVWIGGISNGRVATIRRYVPR